MEARIEKSKEKMLILCCKLEDKDWIIDLVGSSKNVYIISIS